MALQKRAERSLAKAALLGALCLLAAPAAAQAEDPWFARDKALHFGASAALAAGGYAGASLIWEAPEARWIAGAGLALGAGVGKELADLAGAGHASWKDLAWDVAGTGVGLLAAWAIDRLFFHEAPETSRAPTLAVSNQGASLRIDW